MKKNYFQFFNIQWKSDLDIIVKNFSKLLYKEYSQLQGEWIKVVSNFKGENSIPIMTIHKSKGLEYEAVYFLGLRILRSGVLINNQKRIKVHFLSRFQEQRVT